MTSRRRPTAVDLDDALAKLIAALAELSPQERAELRASMPVGLKAEADQATAARNEAIELVTKRLGSQDRVAFVPPADVDEWIRLGALDVVIQWIDGTARTCMHMPSHHRPEPVFAAAWRPGLVVCAGCVHLLGVSGIADKTCDFCGHVCEGVDEGDAVYCGTVFLGELTYQFGTCLDCRPDLGNEGVA